MRKRLHDLGRESDIANVSERRGREVTGLHELIKEAADLAEIAVSRVEREVSKGPEVPIDVLLRDGRGNERVAFVGEIRDHSGVAGAASVHED